METELANSQDILLQRAKLIHFEHPLSERYRFFLRLEYLFKLMDHNMRRDSPENSHNALSAFLDIVNVVGRTDIKTESVKELERIAGVLAPLVGKPGIEHTRLHYILQYVKQTSAKLRELTGPIDKQIKEDELLKILQLRNNIPGGMCDFDLPAYRFWLKQSSDKRIQDLETWFKPYSYLRNAIEVALELIRTSESFENHVAEAGIYKQLLDTKTQYQLIVVSLPEQTKYYPEFSGSRHRFSIRFIDTTLKYPAQTTDDVKFYLSCCKL